MHEPLRFPMPDGGASWVLARSIAFARAAHEAARKGLLVQQGDDATTGRSPGQSTTTRDRISIAVLEAIRAESSSTDLAIKCYRFVIDHAQTDRELAFFVPAYLRLSELLEQVGRKDEALAVADQFLKV